MPFKVRCPACGKSARFPESDAGLPAICAACGTRHELPPAPAVAPTVDMARTAHGSRMGVGGWIVVVLAMVAAGLAAAMAISIGAGSPQAKASTVVNEVAPGLIAAMKSQAEALMVSGDAKGAHRKYTELEELVAGKRIDDAAAQATIAAARVERQAVYDRLIQAAASAPPPAQAPPSPVAELPAAEPPPAESPPAQSPPAQSPTVESSVPPAPASVAPVPASVAPEPSSSAARIPRAPSEAIVDPQAAPTTEASTPPSSTGRPPLSPMPVDQRGLTDQRIGQSITAAVEHLLSLFDDKTHTLKGVDISNADGGGRNALAVYALMQAGRAVPDARLNIRGPLLDKLIGAMKRSRLDNGHAQTYARAVRATALSMYNRPQDRDVLRQDVQYLLQTHSQGAYTYSGIGRSPGQSFRYKGNWDNSNSQYGLLGVWSGSEVGIEVPKAYWKFVEQHWAGCQLPDGTWDYAGEQSPRLSMTVAGIASLFVTHEWLHGPHFGTGRVGRQPFSPALRRGLEWLESDDNAVSVGDGGWAAYTLYGVERVGLASGFKYFGSHDWYRELAQGLIERQHDTGGWGEVVDTSFCLLFLARGRHPILMNKLRFERSENDPVGYWANRPRDVANLARYATKQFERDLNWQVVPLNRDYTDWLDSPILYLSSHKAPKLEEADLEKLRAFVEAGGLLFTQADGDSQEFNDFAERLALDLFRGQYEMQDVKESHPVYDLLFKVDPRPPLRAVSNGARLLMVHSPRDISRYWQSRDERERKHLFQFGVNLFLYAGGKRDLRNRLDSTHIPDPGKAPNGNITVARLSYAGNWDPEPGAWNRYVRWFQRQTGTGINLRFMKISSLTAGTVKTVPFAHLTGTARHDFSEAEARALRDYVEAGGVVLIDPCGGPKQRFAESAQLDLMDAAFPKGRPSTMYSGHPLVSEGAEGMETLAKPRLRQYAMEELKDASAGAVQVVSAGKGHVILSPLDVTSGLLGTGTWGITGYEPAYCHALLKNAIFWTLDGQPVR